MVAGDRIEGAPERAETARTREHALVVEYLPRVHAVVRRLAQRLPPSVDREELVQGGVLGLIDAVRRFDAAQGCSFGAYAEIRVRGAVIDQLRALDRVPRKVRRSERALERGRRAVEQRECRAADADEIAQQLGISRDEFELLRASLHGQLRPPAKNPIDEEAASPSSGGSWRECESSNPLRALDLRRERHAIAEAVASLPRREREVLSLLYWEELPLEQAARTLGCDVGRVRQLHNRGLLRLRSRLRAIWE